MLKKYWSNFMAMNRALKDIIIKLNGVGSLYDVRFLTEVFRKDPKVFAAEDLDVEMLSDIRDVLVWLRKFIDEEIVDVKAVVSLRQSMYKNDLCHVSDTGLEVLVIYPLNNIDNDKVGKLLIDMDIKKCIDLLIESYNKYISEVERYRKLLWGQVC
jgi:hypothetical protein